MVERGFTLLELMIIIVVGIIIAGAALPAAHTLDDQWAVADARVLEADLMFAQARAVATGQIHRVLFDAQQHTYQIESPPGTILSEPLSKTPWVRELGGTDGTEIASADFGGASAVLFDAAGTPDSGGEVVLVVGEFQATVRLEAVTGVTTVILP